MEAKVQDKLQDLKSGNHPQPQKVAQQVVEEGRMVLPGIQALFGFQLIAVFNARFTELSLYDQCLHFASMLLVAFATALIMTPAAYHRQVEQAGSSWHFVRLASRLVSAAMLPLALGLSLNVYVLAMLIFGSFVVAIASASVLFLIFIFLWFVFPQTAKWRRCENCHDA